MFGAVEYVRHKHLTEMFMPLNMFCINFQLGWLCCKVKIYVNQGESLSHIKIHVYDFSLCFFLMNY